MTQKGYLFGSPQVTGSIVLELV